MRFERIGNVVGDVSASRKLSTDEYNNNIKRNIIQIYPFTGMRDQEKMSKTYYDGMCDREYKSLRYWLNIISCVF